MRQVLTAPRVRVPHAHPTGQPGPNELETGERAMAKKDICRKCWHEGCDGSCESAQQRSDRLRIEQVKKVAKQRKQDAQGRR